MTPNDVEDNLIPDSASSDVVLSHEDNMVISGNKRAPLFTTARAFSSVSILGNSTAHTETDKLLSGAQYGPR